MSGLEAIGVAAAILQFVDFASKLLVTGYDVYKSQEGAIPRTIHTQSLCTELHSISAQLNQAPTGSITLNEREKSLWRLADRSHDLAWHLRLLLDSLKLKRATFRSWGALRQSWRILHQKDKITAMSSQLEEIRSLMDTNLLVLLRDDTSLLIRLVDTQTQQSKHIHDDNIASIQSLKHDLLSTMQQHWASTLQSQDTSLRTIGDQLAQLAQRGTALEKSERILESLYCKEVYDREHQVSDAENRTFDWAFTSWCSGHLFDCGCLCTESQERTIDLKCFRHGASLTPPCTNTDSHQQHLLRWLKHHTNEPFVITGKPGSGKSTFMKSIGSHKQTRLALASWAGNNRLIMASFYFWSSGSPMQRSQEGLLRSLLYQILSQAPEMIPKAVPGRWQAATDRPRTNEPWTRKDIAEAFSNVVNGNLLNTKFCFFIDGFDEYGGSDLRSGESDLDLVLQLKKLASSPHVKLCLSSRPRNVVQRHLISSESCHIILHNHTANDIRQFVQSRIKSVQQLIDIDNSDLEGLQTLITKRSKGVFLWVVLVVRELLDGLDPPFLLQETKERLLLLPETLDDYFQRILNRVHQHDRRFATRLLLMTIHEYFVELDIAYFLWLLNKEDVFSCQSSLTRQQQSYDLPQNWQSIACLQIRKSCGDLLDIFAEPPASCVAHTHRSVADFLKLPEVRLQLLAHAGWQDSDIDLAFCRTYLSSFEQVIFTSEKRALSARRKFSRFMVHAAMYESKSGKACADLIYKLDSTLRSQPPAKWPNNPSAWIRRSLERCFTKAEWTIPEPHALLFYAAFYGLHVFVDQAIASMTQHAAVATLNGFLRALLLNCYQRSRSDDLPTKADMVAFLCGKGANPNDAVQTTSSCTADGNPLTSTWTIWELYLGQGIEAAHSKDVYQDDLGTRFIPKYCVIDRLIEGGADLRCKLPAGCVTIQQAIQRRIEIDYHARWPGSADDVERLERYKHVKSVLLKRGYVWIKADGKT